MQRNDIGQPNRFPYQRDVSKERLVSGLEIEASANARDPIAALRVRVGTGRSRPEFTLSAKIAESTVAVKENFGARNGRQRTNKHKSG